ncbi:MAG: hypothetical protein ACK4YO_01305 [Candidatus Altarchaeaceae archaeon]
MDLIKIDYTGKLEDGTIFVTTKKEIADKNDIYIEGETYKPEILYPGEEYDPITKKIIEELKECKVNDKKSITIPKELTGKYDPKLVKTLPSSIFKKGTKLLVGQLINYQGKIGKIVSVGSGRVVVDFNSITTGKTLIYDVEVKGIAKTDEEKLSFIIEKVFDHPENIKAHILGDEKDKYIEITLPKEEYFNEYILHRKQQMLNSVSRYLKIHKIIFKEEWKI